jgi:starch-binding outer membrane protein, SusD/RagB family
MRGLRWIDIKRLNKEGAGIVLKRLIGDKTYTLQPNDPRYALPLPADIILNTGMQQN